MIRISNVPEKGVNVLVKAGISNAKKEKDYIAFLYDELNEVDLSIDVNTLEEDLSILEKADEIKHNLKQFIYETGEKENSIIQQFGSNVNHQNTSTTYMPTSNI